MIDNKLDLYRLDQSTANKNSTQLRRQIKIAASATMLPLFYLVLVGSVCAAASPIENEAPASESNQEQQQSVPTISFEISPRGLNIPLLGDLAAGLGLQEKNKKPPSTTVAPTTTLNPVAQFSKNVGNVGSSLVDGSKVLENPLKMINSLINSSAEIARANTKNLDNATQKLVKATETTSKMLSQLGGLTNPKTNTESASQDKNDDFKYYEFAGLLEPYAFRKSKYFSHECQFRFFCEIGKLSKELTLPLFQVVESNRFLQDLQNRYSRALTYGSVHGQCERYYCALLQVFDGPVGMAKGLTAIANRFANPDQYENYAYTNV